MEPKVTEKNREDIKAHQEDKEQEDKEQEDKEQEDREQEDKDLVLS